MLPVAFVKRDLDPFLGYNPPALAVSNPDRCDDWFVRTDRAAHVESAEATLREKHESGTLLHRPSDSEAGEFDISVSEPNLGALATAPRQIERQVTCGRLRSRDGCDLGHECPRTAEVLYP